MIAGIGVDILELRRIAEMSKKMGWTLAHRVLGPTEMEVYAGLSDDNQTATKYLARRFAAKEAAIKALGLASTHDMREIQILNNQSGAPYVLYKNNTLHVTISDSDSHVVAVVIWEKR